MKKIQLGFNLKNSDKISVVLYELSDMLDKITANVGEKEKKNANLLKNLITKIKETKWLGNDSGHSYTNIGFNEKSLPSEISDRYKKLKKDVNLTVYGFDTMALILSLLGINESNSEEIKKFFLYLKIYLMLEREKGKKKKL